MLRWQRYPSPEGNNQRHQLRAQCNPGPIPAILPISSQNKPALHFTAVVQSSAEPICPTRFKLTGVYHNYQYFLRRSRWQTGQWWCSWVSHRSMHSLWYPCAHVSNLIWSPFSMPSRHIWHSCPLSAWNAGHAYSMLQLLSFTSLFSLTNWSKGVIVFLSCIYSK